MMASRSSSLTGMPSSHSVRSKPSGMGSRSQGLSSSWSPLAQVTLKHWNQVSTGGD